MSVSPKVFWIGMIVGLLSLSVVVNMVVLFVYAGAPSEALEDDWEAKAKNWNEIQRQNTISRQLGWTIKASAWQADPEDSAVLFTLRDQDGKPLEDAMIKCFGFHMGQPDQSFEGEAAERDGGDYRFLLPEVKEGYYEFRVDLTCEGKRFTHAWKEYYQP